MCHLYIPIFGANAFQIVPNLRALIVTLVRTANFTVAPNASSGAAASTNVITRRNVASQRKERDHTAMYSGSTARSTWWAAGSTRPSAITSRIVSGDALLRTLFSAAARDLCATLIRNLHRFLELVHRRHMVSESVTKCSSGTLEPHGEWTRN